MVLAAAAGFVIWLINSARNGLGRELELSLEAFRKDYPELDDEALFRFMVHKRHPEWDSRRIQDLTEDCPSIGELARRLKREEAHR